MQNSPSTVWDTALLSYALQEAQVPKASKVIHNASAYLLRKQQTKKVDWVYMHRISSRVVGAFRM